MSLFVIHHTRERARMGRVDHWQRCYKSCSFSSCRYLYIGSTTQQDEWEAKENPSSPRVLYPYTPLFQYTHSVYIIFFFFFYIYVLLCIVSEWVGSIAIDGERMKNRTIVITGKTNRRPSVSHRRLDILQPAASVTEFI